MQNSGERQRLIRTTNLLTAILRIGRLDAENTNATQSSEEDMGELRCLVRKASQKRVLFFWKDTATLNCVRNAKRQCDSHPTKPRRERRKLRNCLLAKQPLELEIQRPASSFVAIWRCLTESAVRPREENMSDRVRWISARKG